MSVRWMCLTCVALLCIVAAECRWLGINAPVAPSRPMQPEALLGPLRQSLAFRQPEDADKMVETVLKRPVFSQSRRPDPAAPNAVERQATLPRLSAIIHAPNFRRAIFQSQSSGKPIVEDVGEGQTVNDWMVRDIQRESVAMTRDGQTVLVTPSFGEAAMQSPPKPRPVSRWLAPADSGVLRARWSNPQLQP
jgi:hypothetical protein